MRSIPEPPEPKTAGYRQQQCQKETCSPVYRSRLHAWNCPLEIDARIGRRVAFENIHVPRRSSRTKDRLPRRNFGPKRLRTFPGIAPSLCLGTIADGKPLRTFPEIAPD